MNRSFIPYDEAAPLLERRYSSYDATPSSGSPQGSGSPALASAAAAAAQQSPHCCTVFCTILSISSSIFMCWIALYASMGWNYQQHGWAPETIPAVRTNCLGAAGMWAGTACVSLYFWNRTIQRNGREFDLSRQHHHE